MKITVKVFHNDSLKFSRILETGSYRAGKSEFSDIVLGDDKINRSAVEIRVSEGGVYFTNMGPIGKLKLNGKKQETGEIKDGSAIEVGEFKLSFVFGVEEPASMVLEKNLGSSVPRSPEPEAEQLNNPLNNDIFGDQLVGNINGETPQNIDSEKEPEPDSQPEDNEGEKSNVVELKPENGRVFDSPEPQLSSGNLALKDRTETFAKALVAKVMITEGPRKGEEIPLQSFELSFGRSSKADVVINDHKLSRIHAKIIRFGNGYRIIDLNSHNGTRVNGVRILEHPLSSYDVIEFGSTKIKFLIHDVVLNDGGHSTTLVPVPNSGKESTKSMHIDAMGGVRGGDVVGEFPESSENDFNSNHDPSGDGPVAATKRSPLKILAVVLIAVFISFWLISMNQEKTVESKGETKGEVAKEASDKASVLPKIPKDFSELSEEMQRRIEGYYNSAFSISQRSDASKEDIEKAKEDLARIHQSLPYYKNSRELLEQLDKRYRDKLAQIAAEKAKEDEEQDLNLYLEDGLASLKQGEFDRAAEYFQFAINLSPRNPIAKKGLEAALAKVRDLESVPPEVDPELEKIKQVKELYARALEALSNRAYQEAIELAESIRKIIIKGDQSYLNEAKQIIDRAKIAQKDEFEPFLLQAKEKFSEGDYNASRDLCEEMLKKDSAYEEAKELLAKSKKQLNRMAKEAYTHGYILESIGQIEPAKQFWTRAKNYVRPGDEYYDKVNKKLEQYQ